jgi:hypothetical protein
MPKQVVLYNQHIHVEKSTEIDPDQSTDEGPVVVEIWTLTLTDKGYGDQIKISFPKAARDELVRGLMGGVVLPGV